MGQHKVMGIIVIFIGLAIILNIIGLASLLLGPLILLVLAVFLMKRRHPLIGLVIGLVGIATLFQHIFHYNSGSIIVSIVFVYIGYRLLTGKGRNHRNKHRESRHRKQGKDPLDLHFDHDNDWVEEEMDQFQKEHNQKKRSQTEQKTDTKDGHTFNKVEPTVRSVLLGDFHLMNHHFELEDLIIRNGIGDVKIDLTKAIIPEGETVLVVSAWIGDIDIYVPYDLDLAVSATVTIGDLDILSDKQGGFQRHVSLKSKNYGASKRRVKLILSLLIGDIDVRVL